jgi:hypothetical protein
MDVRLVACVMEGDEELVGQTPGVAGRGVGLVIHASTASHRFPRAAIYQPRRSCDLSNTLAAITDRKVGFRSLGDTWADTTTGHGRLMLTVLGDQAMGAQPAAPWPRIMPPWSKGC